MYNPQNYNHLNEALRRLTNELRAREALIVQIGAALDIRQVDTAKFIVAEYLDGQEFKKEGVGE